MDAYIVVLAGFGVVVLLTAWLPMVLKELPLSLPIFCVGLGAAHLRLSRRARPCPIPMELAIVERLSEFVVIVSLMGAGLKIDRPFGWKRWRLTWRLLGIAMPLTILGLAWLGQACSGSASRPPCCSRPRSPPTDPVLASDVQVGPPGRGRRTRCASPSPRRRAQRRLRLSLRATRHRLRAGGQTGEWSPNGSPMRLSGRSRPASAWATWSGGCSAGSPSICRTGELSRTGAGFVALGITCIAYGLTEMVRGYGFLAVFVAALALRAPNPSRLSPEAARFRGGT